jgi:hypothetical protein
MLFVYFLQIRQKHFQNITKIVHFYQQQNLLFFKEKRVKNYFLNKRKNV